ncbi:catalase-like [Haemaphysalis longicornis]
MAHFDRHFFGPLPESTLAVMHVFSDRGIPDGYRHMDEFGCHAFKLVNADRTTIYSKFHVKNDQGSKNLSAREAEELTSKDPDYYIRDLYNSTASKDYPTWTWYIQVMTFEQARTWTFNPFDVTKNIVVNLLVVRGREPLEMTKRFQPADIVRGQPESAPEQDVSEGLKIDRHGLMRKPAAGYHQVLQDPKSS